MKLDVFKHEQSYKNWKEYVESEGVNNMTKKNSDTLKKFIFDMEIGRNISIRSKKGGRSYARLNNLRQRMSQMMRVLESRGIKDITKFTEKQMMDYFDGMRKGDIKTARGEKYKSVQDYAKVFKSFWHWWMKKNRKKGIPIIDITEDLDTSKDEQPAFTYITKSQLYKQYMPYFTEDEQFLLAFVFDSIIRSPTELLSLKVGDCWEKNGEWWINIPEEIAKTRGRQFNLMDCGDELKKYIERKELKATDRLFQYSPLYFNRKMKKIAEQIWGDRVSHPKAKGRYNEITLYDLRHSGAIHLRMLANKHPEVLSTDTIKTRGGWSDDKMLNYYTAFIGLTGEIKKGKMLLKEDKTKLEKLIDKLLIRIEELETRYNTPETTLVLDDKALEQLNIMAKDKNVSESKIVEDFLKQFIKENTPLVAVSKS